MYRGNLRQNKGKTGEPPPPPPPHTKKIWLYLQANGCVSTNNTKCNKTAALVSILKTTVVLQYATDEARVNFVNWYFMGYKLEKKTPSSFCSVFISLNV